MVDGWDWFGRVLDVLNLAVVVGAVWLTQKAARREDPVFEVQQADYNQAGGLHWFHLRVLNVGRRDASIKPIRGAWAGMRILPCMVFVASQPEGFTADGFKRAQRQGAGMPTVASGHEVHLHLAFHPDNWGNLDSARLDLVPVYGKGAKVRLGTSNVWD